MTVAISGSASWVPKHLVRTTRRCGGHSCFFSVLEGFSLTFGRIESRVRSLRGGSARLGEVASRLAEIHGDRRALTQDGTISYADLAASVDEIAGGLAQAGVEAGRPALVST